MTAFLNDRKENVARATDMLTPGSAIQKIRATAFGTLMGCRVF